MQFLVKVSALLFFMLHKYVSIIQSIATGQYNHGKYFIKLNILPEDDTGIFFCYHFNI